MQYNFQQIAAIISICGHIPIVTGLLKNKTEQSFATFLLWAMLDIIATITTLLEEGNFWLPLGNAFSSITVAVLLTIKKHISWSWIETMTAILVIICILTWWGAGEKAGILSSSLAIVTASIPQMVETYRKPMSTPTGSYLIFLVANILSFVAGLSWTIEERFYPGCGIFLCSVIALLSMRKNKAVIGKQ